MATGPTLNQLANFGGGFGGIGLSTRNIGGGDSRAGSALDEYLAQNPDVAEYVKSIAGTAASPYSREGIGYTFQGQNGPTKVQGYDAARDYAQANNLLFDKDWDYYASDPLGEQRQLARDHYTQHGMGEGRVLDAAATEAWRAAQRPEVSGGPAAAPAAAPAADGGYYASGLGFTNPAEPQYRSNPYLDQIADSITRHSRGALDENLAGIRDRSMAAGGYGGSRQGVAEGVAIGKSQEGLSDALGQLYFGDYTNQQNRDLQRYGMDQNFGLGMLNSDRSFELGSRSADLADLNSTRQYDLGLRSSDLANRAQANNYDLGVRNNDLGFANLDRSIWNDNQNWQLQGANFGLNALDKAAGWQRDAYQVGTQAQDRPLDYYKQFADQANQIANGFGSSSTTYPGSPVAGAFAGWQLGNSWGKAWK